MRIKYFFAILACIVLFPGAIVQAQSKITVKELKKHTSYLASDELKGRKPGREGGTLAAEYIRNEFKSFASLMGDNGFQYFDVVVDVNLGARNTFLIGDFQGEVNKDFAPYAYSSSTALNAAVVFVGYGLEIAEDTLKWDDYKGVDVKDKWVLMLKGDPENTKNDSRFLDFSGERDKVLLARDKGAKGVLFVSGVNYEKEEKLITLNFDKTSTNSGIQVVNITRELADKILAESKHTIEDLEKIIDVNGGSKSFEVSTTVNASTELILETVKAQNVIAMIEGSDPILKNSYIVIGGHYDHLGMGGFGSGSREPDVEDVHNGADDNASGVAGIIEIGERLAAVKGGLKRSVILIAFDAEEMGLLGSKFFTSSKLIDIKSITAMFNFDMIGRLNEEQKILIYGTGTSTESENILKSVESDTKLKFAYLTEGYGPSDHASFYTEDIPVFSITTGIHTDYHTPADDTELINFKGQKMVADYSFDLINAVDNWDENLAFQIAGPKVQRRSSRNLKVTLGIMPDFASTEGNGLGVGGVTPGKPADKAGMLKGDRIIALDGKSVNNIYDYMNRLKKLEAGQMITVDVMRGDEKIILIVNL